MKPRTLPQTGGKKGLRSQGINSPVRPRGCGFQGRTKRGAGAFKAVHAYAGASLWNSLISPFS